jgi:hypothetical protein
VIAAFQAALALGLPFGRAAWGGAHPGRLPANLRRASAVSVVILAIGALVVLARAGVGPIALPEPIAYWGTWLYFVLSAIGAVVNFASSSPYERFGWGPFAAVMTVACLVVGLS